MGANCSANMVVFELQNALKREQWPQVLSTIRAASSRAPGRDGWVDGAWKHRCMCTLTTLTG